MTYNRKVGLIVVETIIFAMIAAFLGLRLYSVLGKRTGHEPTMGKPAEEPVSVGQKPAQAEEARDAGPARITQVDPFDAEAAIGIRAIAAADGQFNAADFIGGAKSAYAMILGAYWKGEEDVLSPFVNDDVREAFGDAIKARQDAGEVLDNRLVSIERAIISHAELDGKTARVTVQFDADIAAVTRNSEGAVIAGSLTDAVATHDTWTFERQVRASDPNWILVDTDEAA